MIVFLINRILPLTIFLFSFTSCAPVFENNYDVMARQALLDLMKAQESYRDKHNTYTKELTQLYNYNLKYHTGIVYIEIQSAGNNDYRAISLPAESTTARVFVYDTSEGGFYEADEVEVSKYVLGALNFVRSEKKKQRTNTLLLLILLSSLVILGFRFISKYNGKENNSALISYFVGLFPLGWAVAALNNLTSDIAFSPKISLLSGIAMILSCVSIIITSKWIGKRDPLSTPAPIVGLAVCTLFIGIVSVGVVSYTLYAFNL